MATISVTAAEVIPDSSATVEAGTAGATVTAGQAVYKDADDSDKWKLAVGNVSADEAGQDGVGIAVNAASNGQPIKVCTAGTLDMGASATGVTDGVILCVGADTAGAVETSDDAGFIAGIYMTVLAVGIIVDTVSDRYVKVGPLVSNAPI